MTDGAYALAQFDDVDNATVAMAELKETSLDLEWNVENNFQISVKTGALQSRAVLHKVTYTYS